MLVVEQGSHSPLVTQPYLSLSLSLSLLQGDWDVLGFEKISLWNLLGDIFSRRCNSFTLKKTWVHGGWRDPQTGPCTEYTEILRREYTKALHTMDIRPHIKSETML